MIRKRYVWKVRDREIQLGERTLIMGVLNVTPDSFSDGGTYAEPEAAAQRGFELQELGADILDIGAESTRPGSERISAAEELRRLIPVLKKLRGQLDIPISVDTYKPEVAQIALDNGAEIINDPSGLTWEPDLAKVAAGSNAGLILNHTRGTPDMWLKQAPLHDVAETIRAELEASVNRARRAGVERDRIVVDPGLGFGKRQEQNADILARLFELQTLGMPLLVGPSRKSFLPKSDRRNLEFATAAAVTMCVAGGAHMVRVHDVTAMTAAVQVADAIVSVAPRHSESAERTEEKRQRTSAALNRAPGLEDETRRRPIMPPGKKSAPAPERVTEPRPAYRRPPREEGPRPPRPPREYRPAAQGEDPSRDRFPRRPAGGPGGNRSDNERWGDRPRNVPAGGRSGSPPRRDRPSGPPRRGPSQPFRPGSGRPPRRDK